MGRGLQCRLVAFWILLVVVSDAYEVVRSDGSLTFIPHSLLIFACLLMCHEAALVIYVTVVPPRSFKRLDVLQIPYTLKWGDAKFEWISARTRHSYGLRDVRRWAEKKDKFFILTNDNMLWIIGKKFFQILEDMESLRRNLSQLPCSRNAVVGKRSASHQSH
jgi:hypothetical protein